MNTILPLPLTLQALPGVYRWVRSEISHAHTICSGGNVVYLVTGCVQKETDGIFRYLILCIYQLGWTEAP